MSVTRRALDRRSILITVTALGILLLLTGAGLIVVETHVSSLGILAVPGVLALVAGSVLAVSGIGGGLGVVIPVAFVLALCSVFSLGAVLRVGRAARRRRVRTGAEALVGQTGVVRSWGERGGRVLLEGTLWRARRAWPEADERELSEGDVVVVEQLSGLTLAVRCAEEWELFA
jgi:membrane-bound serine protease (ClpP class)